MELLNWETWNCTIFYSNWWPVYLGVEAHSPVTQSNWDPSFLLGRDCLLTKWSTALAIECNRVSHACYLWSISLELRLSWNLTHTQVNGSYAATFNALHVTALLSNGNNAEHSKTHYGYTVECTQHSADCFYEIGFVVDWETLSVYTRLFCSIVQFLRLSFKHVTCYKWGLNFWQRVFCDNYWI